MAFRRIDVLHSAIPAMQSSEWSIAVPGINFLTVTERCIAT